jgi:hypothetical protein
MHVHLSNLSIAMGQLHGAKRAARESYLLKRFR